MYSYRPNNTSATDLERLKWGLAKRIERASELPRGVRKGLGVLACLCVSWLCISGGSLIVASFMHVVITKLDMPAQTSYPAIYQIGSPSANKAPLITVVPRQTIAKSLDHLVIAMHNPADSLIQSNAVDFGLLLQRQVHSLLSQVFASATRTPSIQTDVPQGVPLTNGQ